MLDRLFSLLPFTSSSGVAGLPSLSWSTAGDRSLPPYVPYDTFFSRLCPYLPGFYANSVLQPVKEPFPQWDRLLESYYQAAHPQVWQTLMEHHELDWPCLEAYNNAYDDKDKTQEERDRARKLGERATARVFARLNNVLGLHLARVEYLKTQQTGDGDASAADEEILAALPEGDRARWCQHPQHSLWLLSTRPPSRSLTHVTYDNFLDYSLPRFPSSVLGDSANALIGDNYASYVQLKDDDKDKAAVKARKSD